MYDGMMKFIFLFLFSLPAIAQNIPVCPPESFVVEFISPTTHAKKAFCAYQKNGETIKHGEELIFDTNGVVKNRLVHNHGQEGEEPVSAAPVAVVKGYKIPGTEEATANFTDTLLGSKPLSEEEKLLSAIHELMAILTLKKAGIGSGKFKVTSCDNQPQDWAKAAIFNTSIIKSYAFKDSCDVSGSFNANFKDIFPFKFDLRNLQDFSSTSMKVRMKVKQSPAGFRYGFEVLEGVISAPSRNANFTVVYEVDIDPLTGAANPSSQKGKVTLIKINGKEVQASGDLKF